MNDNTINIDFDENGKQIKYAPHYYTIPIMALELSQPESTIRYWYTKFERFFDVNSEERNKRFTQKDFEVMKCIKTLKKDQNFTLDQIYEYLISNVEKIKNNIIIDSNLDKNFLNNKLIQDVVAKQVQIELKNILPDVIKFISSELEVQNKNIITQNINNLNSFQDNLSNLISKEIKLSQDTLKNEFKSELNTISRKLDESENKSFLRDTELSNSLKENLELKKKEFDKKNIKKKKTLWNAIFG